MSQDNKKDYTAQIEAWHQQRIAGLKRPNGWLNLVRELVAAQPAEAFRATLADLLAGAVALANEEVGTIVWFAVRTHADTFWIFDAFPDEAARDAHANGAIVAALMANQHLLGAAPEILAADVLASKLP